jgi:hypothetical protein
VTRCTCPDIPAAPVSPLSSASRRRTRFPPQCAPRSASCTPGAVRCQRFLYFRAQMLWHPDGRRVNFGLETGESVMES